MPRNECVLTVFVASPSDVEPERAKLEEIIRELNVAWSRELGVRLDLVRWETEAYPSFGDDPQDVINQQVPDDYDIFVGIMWCRYGTATGRAGSGTVEEFERAKARYDADNSSVQLMFYFKNEAIPPSEVDPLQLARVGKFRDSLGEQGGLYWSFTDIDSFEKFVRLHLTRQVQAWRQQSCGEIDQREDRGAETDGGMADEYDDDGILDLMDVFHEKLEELSEVTGRLTVATEEIGERTVKRTEELNDLPKDATGNADRKAAKRVISKAAADMEQFTARVEAELPLYSEAVDIGMNAFIKAATMSSDLENDEEDVKEGLAAVQALQLTVKESKDSMSMFRANLAALPRMTTRLNRAKRSAVSALGSLLTEMDNTQKLLAESEKVIQGLLQD